MSPSTPSTDTVPAKGKVSVHTRAVDATEDRSIVKVTDPHKTASEPIYSEVLLPKQKFAPPPWVVWGIRYRGWTITKNRIDGEDESQ